MTKNKFFRILWFFFFPAVVFFFSFFIDTVFMAYDILPWIDIPMHFIGGLSVGYTSVLFLKFFREEKLIEIKNNLVFIFIVVSMVSLIAVFWEFHEFFVDTIFETGWQLTLEDTLLDLFMGIMGGFFSSLFFRKI